MNGDISIVEAAKAEQEAARSAPSAPNPNLPSSQPPPSYGSHPIAHAARHAKGRTPPVR